MEKTILQLLIALLISACTKLDMFASFGVISFVYGCFESILWLLNRIYFTKEKDPSQSSQR